MNRATTASIGDA